MPFNTGTRLRCLLWTVTVWCTHVLSLAHRQQVIIIEQSGSDTMACIPQLQGSTNASNTPCRSLNYAFKQMQNKSSIEFLIGCGEHSLDEEFTFTNRANISIKSTCISDITIITCTNGSYIGFQQSLNIGIFGIQLENCGPNASSSSQASTLLFSHSSTITIDTVSVRRSRYRGITFLNTQGTNSLISVEVDGTAGGTGLYIEFDDISCSSLSWNTSQTQCEFTEYDVDKSLFQNCKSFLGTDFVSGTQCMGGGLAIVFKGSTENIRILVTNTTVSGNEALLSGGGAFVGFLENSENNIVRFSNSTFSNNAVNRNERSLNDLLPEYCEVWTSGGGVAVLFSNVSSNNSAVFSNSTADSNVANTGGGMAAVFQGGASRNAITVHSCMFRGNSVVDVQVDVCGSSGNDSTPQCTGNGGGLSVSFTDQARLNQFMLLYSTVSHNTYTDIGGGFSVVHYGNSMENDVTTRFNTLDNNTMMENFGNGSSSWNVARIVPDASGGGACVLYLGQTSENTLTLLGSYSRNTAVRGGGLFVGFYNHASNNRLRLSGAIHGNLLQGGTQRSRSGGGIMVEYDTSHLQQESHNTLNISKILIVKNDCGNSYGGGIAILQNATRSLNGDKVSVSDSILANNSCRYGRSIAASSVKSFDRRNSFQLLLEPRNLFLGAFEEELQDILSLISAEFTNVGNDVDVGGLPNAEGVPLRVDSNLSKTIVNITNGTFRSRQFYLRDLSNLHELLQDGQGALYLRSVKMAVRGQQRISCAGLSQGIFAIDSKMFFSAETNLIIKHCIATHGGAIAIYGDTFMTVAPGSALKFVENRALQRGGAIYVRTSPGDVSIANTCFLQYTDASLHPDNWENVALEFHNNTADIEGNSIFIREGLTCIPPSLSYSLEEETARILQWKNIFEFSPANCQEEDACSSSPHVASGPYAMYGENDTVISVADFNMAGRLFNDSYVFSVIPGAQTDLPINEVRDIFNNTSHSTLVVTVVERAFNVTVDPFTTYISNFKVRLRGMPFAHFGTYNQSELPQIVLQSTVNQELFTVLPVRLECCPPGFMFVTDSHQCRCDRSGADLYMHMCDDHSELQAELKSNRWIGYQESAEGCNGRELIFGNCPIQYCSKKPLKIPINASSEDLEQLICGPSNRTGTLCGRCREGYSIPINVNLASPQCASCNDSLSDVGVLIWILSEWVPVIVVMVVILLFNVDLFDGRFNSFLLFAQVVPQYLVRGLQLPGGGNNVHSDFVRFTLFLYNFWNLDFFSRILPPFCLTPLSTMNILGIYSLFYTTGFFPLAAVTLIVILEKLSDQCCKPFRACLHSLRKLKAKYFNSPSYDRAITTFFVLGFTRYLFISTAILTSNSVMAINGTQIQQVAYWDGTVKYYSLEHIGYLIPATGAIVFFVALPTIVLIAFPTIPLIFDYMKNSKYKWLNWIKKAQLVDKCIHRAFSGKWTKHFLDVCQGCFKYKYRIFASIFFLYRIVVMGIVQATLNNRVVLLFQMVFSIVLTVLVSICQPYQKRSQNIIDSLILGNLSLVIALNLYGRNPVVNITFQLILIYLPLVYVTAIVTAGVVKIVKRYIERRRNQKNTNQESWTRVGYHNATAIINEDEDDRESSAESDNVIHEVSWRVHVLSVSNESK